MNRFRINLVVLELPDGYHGSQEHDLITVQGKISLVKASKEDLEKRYGTPAEYTVGSLRSLNAGTEGGH